MQQGKTIINVDESVIQHTVSLKRGWMKRYRKNMVTSSQHLRGVNIIAGISSKGDLYYTVNHGRTNRYSFLLYIIKLCEHLNRIDSDWRSKSIVIVDNASYHRSEYM